MEKSKARFTIGSMALALFGCALIFAGDSFTASWQSVEIHTVVANIGALLLTVTVLQWLFDGYVRNTFFKDIKEQALGSSRLVEAGVSDYRRDSKDVDFSEYFLASKKVTIGVNYSPRLIDNSMALLAERSKKNYRTDIIVIDPESDAARFIEKDYKKDNLNVAIAELEKKCRDIGGDQVHVLKVATVLRYSFVQFDSRIWIVFMTNGHGRRAVPGFFVRQGGSWYDHFYEDILILRRDHGHDDA